MKFLKTISILLVLIVIVGAGAIWLINDNPAYETLYDDSIGRLTGKTFDQTFDAMANDTLAEHVDRHSDPTYICPMHPQIVKGEPSSCPICGMDLVLKEPLEPEPAKQSSQPKEKKILYWVAPMDANYRRDEPGKSLMGMDLVPVYDQSEEATKEDELPKITINASTAQNMGVRIEKAKINKLSRTIKTIGSVTYNEDTLHHVHVRSNGWVERVYTQSLGDKVTKGKVLLEYYSPDILAAQKDLLIARRTSSVIAGRGKSLTESSKSRLRDVFVPQNVMRKISTT